MLHVTSQARVELHERLLAALRKAGPDASSLGFRLMARKERLGLALDLPREADEVVEYEGRAVLIFEPEIADRLKQQTLKVVETTDGARLQLEALRS